MRSVAIAGCGVTRFGRSDRSVVDLLAEASLAAMDDAGLHGERFDDVFVGNMASGEFEGVSGLANLLVSELGLEPASAMKVEYTSGSGGAAFYAGWMAVASGQSNLALVAGGEKMTSASTKEATEIIASLAHPWEKAQGITMPSLAGLLARAYMAKYGATREALAAIAVKNHANGALNPNAHFQKRITIEDVLGSPVISDPLRLYDFCPITDGAAALVLAPLEERRGSDEPVVVEGIGAATDTQTLQERADWLRMSSVRVAGERAYRMAHLGPSDIRVAELHDMATILEVVQSEELGFFPPGKGWDAAERGITKLEGPLPINTSGGLKAKGHPIGATGVAQIAEVAQQLQGRCGQRQVEAEVGLACNLAGFGNGSIVTVLRRSDRG
ncbi:MAG TPA: thiolase domain-containing protein [Thermoplasmata archaeon]|jgi:acetyl-CoA C-acetyltransferase|nr:thiolase domain-containing protein [Thermoplasmata archaeon]